MEDRQRIIQEYVPGKQVTLAHVIPHPTHALCEKLGIDQAGAIGILTITPGEGAIIAGDVATKAAAVQVAFLDRFSGSLVIVGDVESVNSSLEAVIQVLADVLQFTRAKITRS